MSLSPGQRVEILYMAQEKWPVPAGTLGTVTEVCHHGRWTQVWVDWDNGRRLAMLLPDDKYRLVGDLKKPEDYFTNPIPSTMMEEAKKAIEEADEF